MENEQKIGLLEQLEIACVRPKKYNELIKNSNRRNRIAYVMVVAFLLILIESIIPVVAWDISVGGLQNFIQKGLPAFEVTSEGLKMEDKIEIDVAGVAKVIVDPSQDMFTQKDAEEDYPSQILISKNNALFFSTNMAREVKFADLGSGTIDNDTLISIIPMLRMSFAIYLFFLYLTKIVQYLWWSFIFALICRSIVKTEEGKSVTMLQAFTISIYARTLCEVISSVNMCLGGYLDAMVMMVASVFLTMGYIRLGESSVLN